MIHIVVSLFLNLVFSELILIHNSLTNLWYLASLMITYWNVNTNKTKNLWKFDEDDKINTSDMNNRQVCMKILKERNKIKRYSINYIHIWHVDISKCLYWLDICSMKVWWRYVFKCRSFCDVFQSSRKKIVLEIKNMSSWGSTRLIYLTNF